MDDADEPPAAAPAPDAAPRRRARRREGGGAPARVTAYRRLRNPFPPVGVFSEDRVEAIHLAALDLLEAHGMRVLLPEARRAYAAAGARVDEDAAMVRIGRDIVEAALAAAPRSVTLRGATPDRDVTLGPGALTFLPGAGCPNVSDRLNGRRPARLADFEALVRIAQGRDVFPIVAAFVEPQDVAPPLRHYAVTRAQLALSDKPPFVYARGRAQARDGFEMIRLARGLDEAGFAAAPHAYTVINTNAPRQLDAAMAQGLIDFAEAGQLSVVTPFCLMGAMAPVSVAGALVLNHAEALAAITLAQLARPGAPVLYGAFASNVDLRSGAPAFGTPEHLKATLGAGQLARRVGLPWRGGAGSASNANDAQGAHETQAGVWAHLLAGCQMVIHAAGWLEGGLTFGFEKLVTDLEMVQTLAELCAETPAAEADLAREALAVTPPGGHFFDAAHTLERYATAFYAPVVADLSNWGRFEERGARDADARATEVWRRLLDEAEPPPVDPARLAALDAFAARRSAAGGAPPLA